MSSEESKTEAGLPTRNTSVLGLASEDDAAVLGMLPSFYVWALRLMNGYSETWI